MRNLGIEEYLQKTKSINWKIGEIRDFNNIEIMTWYQSLASLSGLVTLGKRVRHAVRG